MERAISNAEDTVKSSSGKNQTGTKQQVQRLKSNANDLKVRLHSVSSRAPQHSPSCSLFMFCISAVVFLIRQAGDQLQKRAAALNDAQENLDQFHVTADDLDSWTRNAVADLEKVKHDMAAGEKLEQVREEFEVGCCVMSVTSSGCFKLF